MATPNDDQFDVQPLQSDVDYYSLLQVGRDASAADIQAAYRQLSRIHHPDKTLDSSSEDMMKALNKAKTVLLDEIQRAEYDDKLDGQGVLSDPKGFLPTGIRYSEFFLQEFNKNKIDFRLGRIHVPGARFEQLLQTKLQKEVLSTLHTHINDTIAPSQTHRPTPLLNIVQASTTLLEVDPYLLANASQVQEKLTTVQTRGGVSPSSSHTPIINLEDLSGKDIEFLSSLLLNDKIKRNHSEMKSSLKAVVPHVSTIRDTTSKASSATRSNSCSKCSASLRFAIFKKSRHMCSECNRQFCDRSTCRLEYVDFAHLGRTEAQPLCSECITAFRNLYTEEWMTVCLQFLKEGTIEATKTALGCLAMALCNCEDKAKPVLDVAQSLHENGLPDLAMPLIASVIKECRTTKKIVNAYILTASVLKSLAEQQDAEWETKLELLQAAKEACSVAERSLDKSMEVPKLASTATSINLALDVLVKEKPLNNDIYRKMTDLWSVRDYEKIADFLITRIFSNDLAMKQKTIEALQCFLLAYEAYIALMKSNDQAALLLLRGILKIEQKQYSLGLTDIERAAWNSSPDLRKAIITTILSVMTKVPIFSMKAFSDLCKSKSLVGICSCPGSDNRGLALLFPQVNEVQFPFPVNWPDQEVVGLNVRGHRKFENAISSQVKEGNWSAWEAALAYIDYVPACSHRTEFPLCFLYASLWLYKHLQANPSLPNSDKYALTQMIVNCVQIAYGMATLRLAPGMKLYVSRLSLSILLHTLQLTKSLATEDNSDLVIHLLQSTLRSCRLCPLWEMPFLPLSEAALFSIKVNRFQSEFLLRLQHVDPIRRPVTEAELQYQIYENDICHVYPLKDPDTARAKAMEELLREKGWSWKDVQNLMTSPLSPRDSDGWLLRRPTLGVSMEYSQLKGFRLKLDDDRPSIELLVVPANERQGRLGLFSQTDVRTILQLNPEDCYPLFFSLDPPSEMEHFHPFQKFRYKPDRIQDTNFLHTMFETDYLMKSFSVGSEVSSKPPYNQRPCKEGLLKGLPHRLVEALKPVAERPGGHQGNVHRFWIQADRMTYSEESSGSEVTFRLSELKMSVRSHPLFLGPDGKLEDTKHKEDPNSPEAQFAADMTSAYNEVSLHFPMFGRLREIAKLQFLGLIIASVLKSLKEKTTTNDVPIDLLYKIQGDVREQHKTQVAKILNDLGSKIQTWPSADDSSAISSAVNKVYNDMPYYMRSQVSRYEIESQIKSVFRDNDRQVLSSIVDGLMNLCERRLSRNTLETHVRNWLVENSSYFNFSRHARTELISLITTALPVPTREDILRQIRGFHLKRYNSFNSYVNSLKGVPNSHNPKACDWVPAALLKEETATTYSLCYGGVTLNPEIKEGYVLPLPSNVQPVRIETSVRGKQIRSYHSQAGGYYRAPNAFAEPAKDQKPAVPPRGSNSYDGEGGSSSSGTGSGSASRSGQSGNPAPTAAGAAGGGRGGGDTPTGSDDEDECDDDEEEDNSTGYHRSISAIQESGKQRFHTLARKIDRNPSISAVNTKLAIPQVLLLHSSLEDVLLKEGINEREKLTRDHLPRERASNFDKHYRKATTITNPYSRRDSEVFDIDAKMEITRNTRNVIYCIRCKRTGKMYVGKTKVEIKKRFKRHLSQIKNPDSIKGNPSKVVTHFTSKGASIDDLELLILDSTEGMTDLEARIVETKWMYKLDTIENGLNKIRSTTLVNSTNYNDEHI